jgi:TRAP-type C4-dicarboxylate transport system permease small subunit
MTHSHHVRTPAFLLRLRSLLSLAERLMLTLACFCVVAVILVTALDVIGRYVLNQALGWAYDTALVLMIGMVFLSIASLQAARGHVAVDVLYGHLPRGGKRVMACIHVIAGIFAFGVIGWMNIQYAAEAARSGWVYGGFGFIPTWLPYGCIGVGCSMMAVRMVEQLLSTLLDVDGSHSVENVSAAGLVR